MKSERGFGLVEILVALGVAGLVILAAVTGLEVLQRGVSVEEGRSAKLSVAEAVRIQLLRKETCLSSFVVGPKDWSSTQEVAVNLGIATIKAGENLAPFSSLHVSSLKIGGFQKLSSSAGTDFIAGDLDLQASSKQLTPQAAADDRGRFQMAPLRVTRLVFEVEGGVAKACYGLDPTVDVSTIVLTMCTAMGGTLDSNKVCQAGTRAPAAAPAPAAANGAGSCNEMVTGSAGGDPNTKCVVNLPSTLTPDQVPTTDVRNYNWQCAKSNRCLDNSPNSDCGPWPANYDLTANGCKAYQQNISARSANGYPTGTSCGVLKYGNCGDTYCTCTGGSYKCFTYPCTNGS